MLRYIPALWFVCRLLGVTTDELSPHSRETISRAQKGIHISRSKKRDLERKMELALYEHLRRHPKAPLGLPRKILDEYVTYSLRHYRLLARGLRFSPARENVAHRVLIREVWAPTLFSIFLRFRSYGLGNEFAISGNWYIPGTPGNDLGSPISVLLDRWLRTTGLRTSYGITKSTIRHPTIKQRKAWLAEKKKLENWLAGRVTPTLPDLLELADGYTKDVEWLDSAETWKARFLFANVLSRVLKEAEPLFEGDKARTRAEIAKMFVRLNSEEVWRDEQGILSDPFIYFAVRLWLADFKASGQLERICREVPKRSYRRYGPEVSDVVIEAARRKDDFARTPGNQIVAHLLRSAGVRKRAKDIGEWISTEEKLNAFLFSFSRKKLNRLIAEEAKSAGELSAPRRTRPRSGRMSRPEG